VLALVLTAWAALGAWAATAAGSTDRVLAALRRRFGRLRAARDAGLTTVEVAIITAVLLGLATALVAAISIVVNRSTGKIK
jgi:hypothetical protein